MTVLPYLDGERTPNLPHAAGTIAGLRHDTEPGQILLAAYEGAVASLVEALELLGRVGSGLHPEAPIVLIGGGARGRVWQETVARLSGRRGAGAGGRGAGGARRRRPGRRAC